MFSVILVKWRFVFPVIFNNQTCIWIKTLKDIYTCAEKLHATWKISVILWYEAVTDSDTGSGCNETNGTRVHQQIVFVHWVRFKDESVLLDLSVFRRCWGVCLVSVCGVCVWHTALCWSASHWRRTHSTCLVAVHHISAFQTTARLMLTNRNSN